MAELTKSAGCGMPAKCGEPVLVVLHLKSVVFQPQVNAVSIAPAANVQDTERHFDP